MTKFRKLENLHIVFWLLKDAGWASNFKIGALAMVVPAVTIAFVILHQQWNNISDRFHNIAVALWICANSIWMIGDFFNLDGAPFYLRKVSLVPFTIGVIVIGYYYLFLSKKNEVIMDDTPE